MNWGGFEVIRGYNRNPKELGIPLTSEVLVDFHMVLYRILYTTMNTTLNDFSTFLIVFN